jgi:hypothetical protein
VFYPRDDIARGDTATPDSNIGRFSLEGAMFLCQPLLEVLAGRGIEDIDAFLKVPSWNDLPDPFSIPIMEVATARVLAAIRNRERITIHGDYDCDGVLGTHILRGVISSLGAAPRPYLPHRDEGYGLNSLAVHHLSRRGTDLLITVDSDTYVCPGDKRLLRKHTNYKDRYIMYKASSSDCGTCSLKPRCTQATRRGLARHLYEDALNRMQERVTPEAMKLRRCTVEHPFATIKYRVFGHPRLLMRGLSGARTEIGIATMAYNLKRITNVLGATKVTQALRRA